MRILVVGVSGTIGRAVVAALSAGNEVISASLRKTTIKVMGQVNVVRFGFEHVEDRAAALEAPRNVRVNAVSPPRVTETLQALKMDISHGLPAARCSRTCSATNARRASDPGK